MLGTHNYFRQLFETLGRPVTEADALDETSIIALETEYHFRFPADLRAYYQVAGKAYDFNRPYNRLLNPDEWFVTDEYFVFMEENQGVMVWGVKLRDWEQDNPQIYGGYVYGGYDTEKAPLGWKKEDVRLREFLGLMLCWQVTYGEAMPAVNDSLIDSQSIEVLEKTWTCVGSYEGMSAFVKPCRVVWLNKVDGEMRAFAGASNKELMDSLAAEIGLDWETSYL